MKKAKEAKIHDMKEDMYVKMGILSEDFTEFKNAMNENNPSPKNVEEMILSYLEIHKTDFEKAPYLPTLINIQFSKDLSEQDVLDLLVKKSREEEIGDIFNRLEDIRAKLSKSDVIENFVKRFGRGNPEHLRNLKEMLCDGGIEITYSEIKDLIDQEVRKQEYIAFCKQMDKVTKKRAKYQDYIRSYVELFGRGDPKTLGYFGQVLSDRKMFRVDFEDAIKNHYDTVAKEQRIKKFQDKLESAKKQDYRLLEEARISMDDILAMDSFEFTSFLANLFYQMGYEVDATRRIDENTRDLLISKMGSKTLVRATNHKGFIDHDTISELQKVNDKYKCDKSAVISVSNFSSAAQKLAKDSGTVLWDKKKLSESIRKYTV